MDGTGTQILTGANTYTGITEVASGTLAVQGSIAATTALQIVANGTNAGNFALGEAAGGASLKAQTVATLTLASVGAGGPTSNNEPALSFNITGNGTNDSLTSTGALTLTGSTFELNLDNTASGATSNTLLTWLASGSTSITTSNVDLVLNGVDMGVGSSDLSITTGTNDTLVFTAAVPEPSTWAMLFMGGLFGCLVLRRRGPLAVAISPEELGI
jgi:autotransporter-associated beta strand protein